MKKTVLFALSTLILASSSAFAADHAAKTDTTKPAAAKAVHQKSASSKKMSHTKHKASAHKASAKAHKKG